MTVHVAGAGGSAGGRFRNPVLPGGPPLRLGIACGLLLSFLAAGLASGQLVSAAAGVDHDRPEIIDVQVGFGKAYKVGHWTPVQITVRGGRRDFRGKLELVALDGDAVNTRYVAGDGASALFPAGRDTQVWRYVRIGPTRSLLTAVLRDELLSVVLRDEQGSNVSSASAPRSVHSPLLSTQPWIVTFGPPGSVRDAARLRRGTTAESTQQVSAVEREASLPDHWTGYEGVDTLIVNSSQPEMLERLTDAQFDALENWVRLGGRMVLCVGAHGESVLGGEGRFARFAPGRFVEVAQQRQTSAIENYAGAQQRLDVSAGDSRREFFIPTSVLENVQGRVDVAVRVTGTTDERPLVVRSPYGFGQVVFVGMDLDQPPVSEWQALPRFLARVLELSADQSDKREEQSGGGRLAHVGYQDLVGQLRSALDQFGHHIRLVPFSVVAGLVVIYILLIGVGDYFLLRKMRRMHWTWVTFPLVAIAFCLLAWVAANSARSSQIWINQVDLVDVDLEQGIVRGTVWANVYSPLTKQYDVDLAVDWPAATSRARPHVLLTWQGLPGKGMGGLNKPAATTMFEGAYTISCQPLAADDPRGRIQDVPVPVAATKSFAARWWLPDRTVKRVALVADTIDHLLSGSIENPLPIELSDCVLYYSNWAYRIDNSLAPGQTLRLDGLAPRIVDWQLTRRQLSDKQDAGATRWDITSFDTQRILEIMMFYEAAGGRAYAQLSNRYQPYVDLSGHLEMGRAVLVGRGDAVASHLQLQQQSSDEHYYQRFAYCRVLFPVEEVAPARRARKDTPR